MTFPLIRSGMLAMLWSLIKIEVSYSQRYTNRSVLVLRHLLADHTSININSAACGQLFN